MAAHPDLHHPTLGSLTYDETLDWYTAALQVGDQPVALNVLAEEGQVESSVLDAAAHLAVDLATRSQSGVAFATSQLLDLKNESWLDEDEAPLEANAFAAALSLESVVVNGDGSADLYYHDGDLFWGHVVVVTLAPDGTFEDASIAG